MKVLHVFANKVLPGWLVCAQSTRILHSFMNWSSVPHWAHGCLTPSWTDLICLLRLLCSVNCWPHCPQGCLTPSWTDILCFARSPCWENSLPHCPQGCLIPSWADLPCLARSPCWENSLPQFPQGCLTLSWTDLLCLARYEAEIWAKQKFKCQFFFINTLYVFQDYPVQ